MLLLLLYRPPLIRCPGLWIQLQGPSIGRPVFDLSDISPCGSQSLVLFCISCIVHFLSRLFLIYNYWVLNYSHFLADKGLLRRCALVLARFPSGHRVELEGYCSELCCQLGFVQRVWPFLCGFLLFCMWVPEGASGNVVCVVPQWFAHLPGGAFFFRFLMTGVSRIL